MTEFVWQADLKGMNLMKLAGHLSVILQSLEVEDHRRLMYAFDNGFCELVEYAPNHFIGVHIKNVPNLKINTEIGAWSAGEIS